MGPLAMTSSKLVHCTFAKDLIREPLLYNLGRDFKIIPNIRGASISDDLGLVYLELEGPDAEIQKAIDFLKSKGVTVDPVTGDAPLP
ncbi:MAG: hypothetical protein DHS20C15_02910 [Planctomycetota bacterium]|nr:MAG: hypothetical protein DHS20C15_02910 [Planctomycetota bacterium]